MDAPLGQILQGSKALDGPSFPQHIHSIPRLLSSPRRLAEAAACGRSSTTAKRRSAPRLQFGELRRFEVLIEGISKTVRPAVNSMADRAQAGWELPRSD